MDAELYKRARQIALAYVKRKIIPSIRKRTVLMNYLATGKYNDGLWAKVIPSSDDRILIGVYSVPYARYVEGQEHGIKSGTRYKESTIGKIESWLSQRGIKFYRQTRRVNEETGRKKKMLTTQELTDSQAAYAIVSKYKKQGRDTRFFVDMIVNQHKDAIRKEILNTIEKEETSNE